LGQRAGYHGTRDGQYQGNDMLKFDQGNYEDLKYKNTKDFYRTTYNPVQTRAYGATKSPNAKELHYGKDPNVMTKDRAELRRSKNLHRNVRDNNVCTEPSNTEYTEDNHAPSQYTRSSYRERNNACEEYEDLQYHETEYSYKETKGKYWNNENKGNFLNKIWLVKIII
jgi:hypothetical protein